jgi:hypothetical protein
MVATVPTPDWLADHDAALRPGVGDGTRVVVIGGKPLYRLTVTPAKNQFSCAVVLLNNGKRLDRGGVSPTADAALEGGLNDLRAALGW